MTAEELRERLERFIARAAGASDVCVEGLHKLPGGASRETWSFDAAYTHDGAAVRLPLVLRRDPGSTTLNTQRREEFRVQAAAFADGLPVPRPFWLAEDADALGAPSYVMQRVDGETLARRLLRDEAYAPARAVMTGQLGAILARIHRIDIVRHELDFLPAPLPGDSPALAELDRYEQTFRGVAPEPHPAFELAFRWLRRRLPIGGRRALVHGDYRIGNVIFGPEGVRAILDWELAHIGDPMADLGWICTNCWRFGAVDKPVGGCGQREDLWEGYEAAGGDKVDRTHALFWELFGSLRWGVMCAGMIPAFHAGESVERGVIARRASENEVDLMRLLDGKGAA